MSIYAIECKHSHHVFQFAVDVDDECDDIHGEIAVRLCQQCHNALKGVVLQDVINEAAKSAALPFPRRR